MTQQTPVSQDLHYEIQCLLFKEARLLDNEQTREWLETIIDPDIHYQLTITQERAPRDQGHGNDTVYVYDERYEELDFRVKQYETGLQWSMTPLPKMRHMITNIEAFQEGSTPDMFQVYSNGAVYRTRKIYEEDAFVFSRDDILKRGEDGALRLVKRKIEFDQRLVRGKNIRFFM